MASFGPARADGAVEHGPCKMDDFLSIFVVKADRYRLIRVRTK